MPEVERVKAPPEPEIKVENPPEAASPKKAGLKTYLIIFLAAQAVFAAVGFFMVIKFLKPDPAFNKAVEDQKAAVETKHEEVVKEVYTIEDVVVNPAGTSGSRYLSVSVGVEMDAEKKEGAAKEKEGEGAKTSPLNEKKPQLRDALIGILSAKTIEQLTALEQKDLIRGEILESFRKILAPKNVYQIYFIEFVLQ